MNEEEYFERLLQIPGARKAAQGVIIELGEGYSYHITGIITEDEKDGLSRDELFFLTFCARDEVLRLRSLRNAHDYLLRLRAMAIVDDPRAVRVFRLRRKAFESSGRPWKLSHYYHSMDGFHKAYRNQLSRPNRKKVINIPSGLALLRSANAMCARSFTGDVIVASEALQHFFYFMNIGSYGEKYGVAPADRGAALLIALRIMAGTESLDFDLDPRGHLPTELQRSIMKVVQSQMEFVFGHEYSHALLNHMGDTPEPVSQEDPILDQTIFRQRAYDLEYEADVFAVSNVGPSQDAISRMLRAGLSVMNHLYSASIMSDVLNLVIFNKWNTHPDPKSRAENLWKEIGKRTSVTSYEYHSGVALAENVGLRVRDIDDVDLKVNAYGSVYLPSFKTKFIRDRIDY